MLHLSSMTWVEGRRDGPWEVFADAAGRRWWVRLVESRTQAESDVLAARLYRLWGVPVPVARLVRMERPDAVHLPEGAMGVAIALDQSPTVAVRGSDSTGALRVGVGAADLLLGNLLGEQNHTRLANGQPPVLPDNLRALAPRVREWSLTRTGAAPVQQVDAVPMYRELSQILAVGEEELVAAVGSVMGTPRVAELVARKLVARIESLALPALKVQTLRDEGLLPRLVAPAGYELRESEHGWRLVPAGARICRRGTGCRSRRRGRSGWVSIRMW